MNCEHPGAKPSLHDMNCEHPGAKPSLHDKNCEHPGAKPSLHDKNCEHPGGVSAFMKTIQPWCPAALDRPILPWRDSRRHGATFVTLVWSYHKVRPQGVGKTTQSPDKMWFYCFHWLDVSNVTLSLLPRLFRLEEATFLGINFHINIV